MKLTVRDLALRLDNEFNAPTIELKECCKKYLGLNPETAVKKFNKGELPIIATRMTESAKAPIIVTTNDLAEYILKRRKDSKRDHENFANISEATA